MSKATPKRKAAGDTGPSKFVFLTDIHWGYERVGGRLKPFHNEKALNAALTFVTDFKPDIVILGGDTLDCGAVSHHNKSKKRTLEGLRLRKDTEEVQAKVLDPLAGVKDKRFCFGNHEDWVQDLIDEAPALEGIVEVETLLDLENRGWQLIPQGGRTNIGKLWFLHGDVIKSSVNHARAAVTTYERNIRYGHFHTLDSHTKVVPDDTEAHTGVAVPGLCNKNPKYLENAPSRWLNGFNYGYVEKDGSFNDYVVVITNGQFTAEGRRYVG
jgi:hypothetical protein